VPETNIYLYSTSQVAFRCRHTMPKASAAAAAAAVTVAVAVVMIAAAVINTAGRRDDNLLQTSGQQRLSQLEEQSQDGGFELDYGKESGIMEAMDGARDDQMNIMMMKAPGALGGNVNKEKLARLQKKMAKFEKEEADFLKVVQKPAQVTLSVTQGTPGKKGPRGFRGQSGAQGKPGVSGDMGKQGTWFTACEGKRRRTCHSSVQGLEWTVLVVCARMYQLMPHQDSRLYRHDAAVCKSSSDRLKMLCRASGSQGQGWRRRGSRL